jgi:phage tail sheath protein FI
MIVDPQVKYWDTSINGEASQPASSRVAGVMARVDAEKGFWNSISNNEIYGITGTHRPVDFELGDPLSRANYLNENEVTTIVRKDGYRVWGNRSTSADPKWAFLCVRRTADMIHESLIRAHLWAVDRAITATYVDDVVEGVQNYLDNLTARGAILGGRCWADEELNTPDQIALGRVYFNFDFTPVYPAERITFRSHLTNDYISTIFAQAA